ncbi:universal stress protein [Zhongshania sp.]|uniref:universal stress protein n=1 Tax=Zhongshania sp. TaxID=1971902 RepID=UPI00356B02A8
MKRINNILCVVDENSSSDVALIQTLRIAEETQADITVASVLNVTGFARAFGLNKDESDAKFAAMIVERREAVESWLKQNAPGKKIKVDIFCGIEFLEIVKSVVKNNYDLVVKCANDVDWLDRLFGSDDMQLLRKCPCPVLMLKPGQTGIFRNILATVDVNDAFDELDINRVQEKLNEKVLDYAAIFSISELADLHVGSVWDAYGEDYLRMGTFSDMPEEKVNSYVDRARRDCANKLELLVSNMTKLLGKDAVEYLGPKVHMTKGLPEKEIPLMAITHNADLVVMGTVARTGIPGFIIGNTAESILEQVHCSILAIKPDGFQTTVLN